MFTCQGTRPDRLAFRPLRSAVCGSGWLLSDDRIPHPSTIVNNNFCSKHIFVENHQIRAPKGGECLGKMTTLSLEAFSRQKNPTAGFFFETRDGNSCINLSKKHETVAPAISADSTVTVSNNHKRFLPAIQQPSF